MAGFYGTVKSAQINIATDVEIFYYYRPTRSTDPETMDGFKSLDSSCLIPAQYDSTENKNPNDILGLYELRLPVSIFNKKGFYTVYIRPKEIPITLTDVSVLAAYPDVKGVVINTEGLGVSDLTGYRIDYFDTNNNRLNTSRIITSCNTCEPVLVTVGDSYPKTTRYRLTDNSTNNLVFCTVTPSVSTSFKPNVTPFIGLPGGSVCISNTNFDPKLIEVEMVDHDADTITYMIEGDQIRNRDKAIITTYNDNHEIYRQQDYYTIKDSLGNPLYDVKRKREYIDTDESYDKRVNNIE